jgi:hypothetical protein
MIPPHSLCSQGPSAGRDLRHIYQAARSETPHSGPHEGMQVQLSFPKQPRMLFMASRVSTAMKVELHLFCSLYVPGGHWNQELRAGATTGDSQALTNSVLEERCIWLRKEYPWHPLARIGKAT